MAGHTFIARIRALLARLFKRPAEGQPIPLNILDGVCCECSATDIEVQDYLYKLRLQDKYKKPRPLDGYLCDEEGISLGKFNARKQKRMEERKKEIRNAGGMRAPSGWGYDKDGDIIRSPHHA